LFCESISFNTAIRSIDLRYNNLTDNAVQGFRQLLENSVSLQELNLLGNNITENGVKLLAQSLQKNSTLKSLRLTGNKIGNKGGMFLAQALQINKSLHHLDVGDCDLRIECIIALSTVLTQNTHLKAVVLNRPIFFSHQEEQAVHISRMLRMNSSLTEIHLEKFDLQDFGLKMLCEGLLENCVLKYLNVSSNRFSRDGGHILANYLKENTPLEILDVSNNRLEDEGISMISNSLALYNTHLLALSVRFNQIGPAGLYNLSQSLYHNKILKNLYVWGNNTTNSKGCAAIGQLLAIKRIKERNTDVRPYVVNGEMCLAELSHGLKRFYYWTPTYGPDLNPYKDIEDHPCDVGDGYTLPSW